MDDKKDFQEVNLLKPKKGYMTDEVKIIVLILLGWGIATFGFQSLIWIMADTQQGCSLFTRHSFFKLPFHFWFTGQFLPLWFIILCVIFNLYIDRLTERHSRRRDNHYD